MFPQVHLHVGCFDSGGTATDHGLHIGFEHFTRPDPFPERLEDTRWSWALHPIERLPWMVVHELAHYQQVSHGDTLLHQALIEGGAEFVALQFAGGVVTPNMDWGLAHEAEVWEAFAEQMDGPAHIGRWFYTDTGTDWPRDLGYFVGFRIAQAYWAQAEDKSQAMVDLIRLEDVDRIADPAKALYAAFGLGRGSAGQLFGAKVMWRALFDGAVAKHGFGGLEGVGFQMPGAFLVRDGRIERSWRASHAGERPDWRALVVDASKASAAAS